MIRANFNAYSSYVTDSLYQWDKNQILEIDGLNLDVAPEIHFTNATMDRAIVRQSILEDGSVIVNIPNSLLQQAHTIRAYIGIYENDTFKTIEVVDIPIIARERPSDYTISDTDEEIYSFNQLENRLNNIVKEFDTQVKENNQVLNARMDTIVSNNNNTDGNSELVDIRVGEDGKVYDSAGAAVRGQVRELKNKLGFSTLLQLGNINNTDIESGTFANANGKEMDSTTNTRCDDFISVVGGNTIYAILEDDGSFASKNLRNIVIYFYDENKNKISIETLYIKNLFTSNSGIVCEVSVPENAKYMRFNATVTSLNYKIAIYYSYYSTNIVENYVEPSVYVSADKVLENGETLETYITKRITADTENNNESVDIVPEYEYNVHSVESLRKEISYLHDYISKLHAPTILDSGVCGVNLTWALYSDGLLKISGTGRSYDYCKGLMIGKTKEEIKQYVIDHPQQVYYGFQEGKNYDETNAQYVAPWYKYRDEVSFMEDGGDYGLKSEYDIYNPNGWKYNRIEIDEGITYLGDWLLYRVCGPTELIIPNSVTELGDWAIRYSPTLKCIYLPDGITKIGYNGCSRNIVATAIRIGSGLKTVGDTAFSYNPMVKYLNIQGDGVNTSFGKYMCNQNTDLEYISFKDVTEIGVRFCQMCTSLKKVDLPETLKTIHEWAFFSDNLTSIKIPHQVTTIETDAFSNCHNLKSVYIDSPTIVTGLSDKNVYGRLIYYAKYIYVKNDITEIGAYLTTKCRKVADIGNYALYIVNE